MRVVIAEDLALLRDGLIRIFDAYGFEVVEAVDNGPSLVRALSTHRPDGAVVNARLPRRSPMRDCARRSMSVRKSRAFRC